MRGFKPYIYFFKSTLLVNWIFSFFLSWFIPTVAITQISIFYWFSISIMTVGFFIALWIKQSSIANKEEYYFYYNFGITKPKLIIFSSVLNALFATLISIGYYFGKQYFIH